MYIEAVATAHPSSNSIEFANMSGLEDTIRVSWEFIVNIVNAFTTWLVHMAPSLTSCLSGFLTVYAFLKAHPHPIHIIFWSIFFGPIIILMPCLLVLELIIIVLFNFNFVTHGLLPGSPEEKYESLKEQFMESRESLFAYVESASAKFNKWTVEFPPLLVLRLVAGIFGFLIFIGIWSGWW